MVIKSMGTDFVPSYFSEESYEGLMSNLNVSELNDTVNSNATIIHFEGKRVQNATHKASSSFLDSLSWALDYKGMFFINLTHLIWISMNIWLQVQDTGFKFQAWGTVQYGIRKLNGNKTVNVIPIRLHGFPWTIVVPHCSFQIHKGIFMIRFMF